MKPSLAVPFALAVLALGVAGCTSTIDSNDLEEQLRTDLAADAGIDPESISVECPEDQEAEEGNEFECTLTDGEGNELTVVVTLTDDEGGFEAVLPPQ